MSKNPSKKQEDLNKIASSSNKSQPLPLEELLIDEKFSSLVSWLLDQWISVPFFTFHVPFNQPNAIAKEILYSLFEEERNSKNKRTIGQWKVTNRFVILIFFYRETNSFKTLVMDTHEKKTFDFDSQFEI
ncbi:MAG: hypothetical protein QNJ70_21320 [Xenococcaceae cyanobacterium MO_207.B15]|nr:hypothetical protein [Xenococcaceae cyanobacterium MO_207.B15]